MAPVDVRKGMPSVELSREEFEKRYRSRFADPAFKPLFGGSAYLEDPAIIEKTQVQARKMLRTLFERLDAQLAGKDYLVGSRSIADPYLFVTLRWAKANNVDLGGLSNLEAFFQRMQADAGVRAAMKEQGLS